MSDEWIENAAQQVVDDVYSDLHICRSPSKSIADAIETIRRFHAAHIASCNHDKLAERIARLCEREIERRVNGGHAIPFGLVISAALDSLLTENERLKAENKRLEGYEIYFHIREPCDGRQVYSADHILEHFNDDGSLKGTGVWRGKEIYNWARNFIAAYTEMDEQLVKAKTEHPEFAALAAAAEQLRAVMEANEILRKQLSDQANEISLLNAEAEMWQERAEMAEAQLKKEADHE